MGRSALVLLLVVAACGDKTFPSICKNQTPPPVACQQTCNPAGPDTCPVGFYCNGQGKCDQQCTQGGMQCGGGYMCNSDGECVPTGCQGIGCNVTNCMAQNKPPTTITGTVFAPNGTLPLYGVNVYVPASDPGAMTPGAVCNKCSDALPGDPIAHVTTDEAGNFMLTDVPTGSNIPLVIVSGKWRREIKIPKVDSCATTTVTAADTTLPKSMSDMTPNTIRVDMPLIAISTGSADSLECLPRKLGIADSEITTDSGAGHIHLYADTGAGGGEGTNSFQSGGNFSDSKTLWNSLDKLKQYDIVILSCEGAQHPETKSQAAMDALKGYADFGGRVFMSHWHNIWIEGSTQGGGNQAPQVWPQIATWSNAGNTTDPATDIIDELNNPKGSSFATWMLNVMGSTVRDEITVHQGRTTCQAVDNTKAERWTYYQPDMSPQNFQFTTPNEAANDSRCGKVVFSDMHVSADSQSSPNMPFPSGCANSALTPQEKALAFMFFDLSACVGNIF